MQDKFQAAIAEAVKEFSKTQGPIGIYSHNDTDGVASATIIASALKRKGFPFQIHFLTRTESEIRLKGYPVYLLLDYGAREVNELARQKPNAKFFVLDHHPPIEDEHTNVYNINPQNFGIDGGTEICAATMCYFFAIALSEANCDLAWMVAIGAVGDSQYKDGKFFGLNQSAFQIAEKKGYVKLEKGLRLYGWGSRPLHKALEYSTEPFIPGISGSESGAVQFLQETGIELKKSDGSWKTLNDLTKDEKKKLAAALIAQRHNLQEHPERIFGTKIILPKYPFPELSEAEVLSTWLNSCAKLKYFGLAVGTLLGDRSAYEHAQEVVQNYRREIISAMNYFFENKDNPSVVRETARAIYFVGKEQINSNLASTISTILSHNLEQAGKILFVFADAENLTKVSIRYIVTPGKTALGELASKLAAKLGGEGGGHAVAAGATIPKGKEEMFINMVEQELNNA